jgi:hypothetical protein
MRLLGELGEVRRHLDPLSVHPLPTRRVLPSSPATDLPGVRPGTAELFGLRLVARSECPLSPRIWRVDEHDQVRSHSQVETRERGVTMRNKVLALCVSASVLAGASVAIAAPVSAQPGSHIPFVPNNKGTQTAVCHGAPLPIIAKCVPC